MSDLPSIGELNGLLECGECSSVWCKHISDMITTGQDSGSIWSDTEASRDIVPITVPFVPTYECFAEVQAIVIESEEHVATARKVMIEIDQVGDQFLCIISPGEARLVIRDAVYAWIRSFDIEVRCKAPGHGYQRQITFQRHCKTPSGEIAEKFSLVVHGMCLTCYARAQVWNGTGIATDPDDFAEDLIPS
jgi:hypothetical protein